MPQEGGRPWVTRCGDSFHATEKNRQVRNTEGAKGEEMCSSWWNKGLPRKMAACMSHEERGWGCLLPGLTGHFILLMFVIHVLGSIRLLVNLIKCKLI